MGFWSDAGDSVQNLYEDVADVNWGNNLDMAQTAVFLGGGFIFQQAVTLSKIGLDYFVEYLVDKYKQDGSGSSTKQRPDLRGASNQVRQGGRVGILLGKHLVNADVAGLPFISISDSGKTQYLHTLFCGGYNNIAITSGSIKIGDSKLNSTTFKDYSLQQTQSGEKLSVYQQRVISKSISKIVSYDNDEGIVATTPTQTYAIHIFITFPQGLIKYKSGKKKTATVQIKIEYRTAGSGEWSTLITPSISGRKDETYRLCYGMFAAGGQYDIRVTRLTDEDVDNDVQIQDKVYFDVLQSYTGSIIDGSPNFDVISSDIASELTLFALKVKSTDTVNGSLEAFNFIGQSIVPVYSGSGTGSTSWLTSAASSNPAALFLYVIRSVNINKKPATSSQIDWAAFETWYTYCNTMSFECNTYITQDTVLDDILSSIANSGRAMWNLVNGKYTVIVDKIQSTPVQLFTPRNSWGFAATRSFENLPTAYNCKYIDASLGYVETERTVFYDAYAEDDTKIDDITLFGCTSVDLAWRHAKYMLNCLYLRREGFSFNADIEHIRCTKWDRISLCHDVVLAGLTSGRVKLIRTTESSVTGIESDERVIFEPGKSYSVIFRDQTGTPRTYTLTNPATDENIETDELVFDTAYPTSTFPVNTDDLFAFGETGSETFDLLVIDIEPGDDMSAKITCLPYVESIYTWDGLTPPEYDPKISVPGDATSAMITGVPIDASELGVENSKKIGESFVASTALSIVQSSLEEISGGVNIPFYPFYDSNRGTILYFDSATGTIFEKASDSTDMGEVLISDAGYVFCNGYYLKSADGKIYDYSGMLIIDEEVWCPQADNNANLYYVSLTDGGIYKYNLTVETTERLGTFSLKNLWINLYDDSSIIIWDDGTISGSGNNELILISTTDGSYLSTIITGIGDIISFQRYEENIITYLDTEFNLYKIINGTAYLYIMGIAQFDSIDGNVYYLKLSNLRLLKQYRDLSATTISDSPYLKTSSQVIAFTGNIENGSSVITGISDTEIEFIDIGDYISGTGIPFGAYIETIDPDGNSIIMSALAEASTEGLVITVSTSRMLLDATKSVAAGTILQSHLSNDAVATVNIEDGAVTAIKIASVSAKAKLNGVVSGGNNGALYDALSSVIPDVDDAISLIGGGTIGGAYYTVYYAKRKDATTITIYYGTGSTLDITTGATGNTYGVTW